MFSLYGERLLDFAFIAHTLLIYGSWVEINNERRRNNKEVPYYAGVYSCMDSNCYWGCTAVKTSALYASDLLSNRYESR